MNQEQLLQRLNSTPLNVNVKLMELMLGEYNYNSWWTSSQVKIELQSVGISVDKHFMETKNIVRYIQEYLIAKYGDARYANREIQVDELGKEFPNDFILGDFNKYKANISLKKRFQSLLKHAKDEYIQPAIQIPHYNLAMYLDCDYYHFDSLKDAIKAISNKKADSQIVTVIKKTVYFRNQKYLDKREKEQQEALKIINEIDFIPLCSYYDDFDLEYLGLSYLFEDE